MDSAGAKRGRGRRGERAGTGATWRYQSGFGSEFASEALPGALPQGQNSPQRVAYGPTQIEMLDI